MGGALWEPAQKRLQLTEHDRVSIRTGTDMGPWNQLVWGQNVFAELRSMTSLAAYESTYLLFKED